jgi:hypothetical protein
MAASSLLRFLKRNKKLIKTVQHGTKKTLNSPIKLTENIRRLKGFEDFASIGSANFFGKQKMSEILKQKVQQEGTGSIAIDMALKGANKISRGKAGDIYYKMQKGLHKADVNVGKHIAKGPFKKLFTEKEVRVVGEGTLRDGSKVLLHEKVNVPRVSGIYEKSKKILPFLGTMYAYDLLRKGQEKTRKAGDSQMPRQEDKEKEKRELIEKISNYVYNEIHKTAGVASKNSMNENKPEDSAQKQYLLKSAVMLEKAANCLHEAQFEKNAIQQKADTLALLLISKERASRSKELVAEMLEKSMIKIADVSTTIDKIMDMSDSEYNVFSESIKMHKEAVYADVDSFSTVVGYGYSDSCLKGKGELSMQNSVKRVVSALP